MLLSMEGDCQLIIGLNRIYFPEEITCVLILATISLVFCVNPVILTGVIFDGCIRNTKAGNITRMCFSLAIL